MQTHANDFPLLYQEALTTHLRSARKADSARVSDCVRDFNQSGWSLEDLSSLHEKILVMTLLPAELKSKRPALIRKASHFFAAVAAQSADSQTADSPLARKLKATIGMLSSRSVTLAFAQSSPLQHAPMPEAASGSPSEGEPEMTNERLRALSRRILKSQEEERKKISRELHDVIVQSLVGVNVRLTTLRKEAALRSKELARDIAATQRLVAKSAKIVHQFARDLRPPVLDDLGLIPALHSFIKQFSKRSGAHVHLTVFTGVEKLDAELRTVLFRVAQEALSNIARHARAERVEVTIVKEPGGVRLQIADDGKAFNAELLIGRNEKHLGLLGMKERIEMVGGTFSIDSAPGHGTTILATIPVGKTLAREWQQEVDTIQTDTP